MGMNIGSNAAGGDPEPIMDINTTPLIDVMLVLLVMLIITIPIQLHSVNLNLPIGEPPHSEAKPQVVKIDIDEHSTLYWNGEALQGRSDLAQRLQAAAQQTDPPEVHVRPNKGSRYAAFTEVMVSINQAGLRKLGVVGSEQFID